MKTLRAGLPVFGGVVALAAASPAWAWSGVHLAPVQRLAVPARVAEQPYRVHECTFQVLPAVRGELSLAEGPNWLEFKALRVEAPQAPVLTLEATPLIRTLDGDEVWSLAFSAAGPLNAGPGLIASARP